MGRGLTSNKSDQGRRGASERYSPKLNLTYVGKSEASLHVYIPPKFQTKYEPQTNYGVHFSGGSSPFDFSGEQTLLTLIWDPFHIISTSVVIQKHHATAYSGGVCETRVISKRSVSTIHARRYNVLSVIISGRLY